MHHLHHDRDVVGGLHDLGVVVVCAVREHRCAAIPAERDAAFGKAAVLGVLRVLVDVRAAENVAVFRDAEANAKRGRLAHPLDLEQACRGDRRPGLRQRRQAVSRADQRIARLATNAHEREAGIEPRPVVGADVDARTARRRASIGIGALVACFGAAQGRTLDVVHFLGRIDAAVAELGQARLRGNRGADPVPVDVGQALTVANRNRRLLGDLSKRHRRAAQRGRQKRHAGNYIAVHLILPGHLRSLLRGTAGGELKKPCLARLSFGLNPGNARALSPPHMSVSCGTTTCSPHGPFGSELR